MILQEAAATRMTTHRLRSGGWTAGLGHGYRIFSGEDNVYPDVEVGRETLVRVARLHVACRELLSIQRCIVLAATGHNSWRLWQIVRAERPLRERLNEIERCGLPAAEFASPAPLETPAWLRSLLAPGTIVSKL